MCPLLQLLASFISVFIITYVLLFFFILVLFLLLCENKCGCFKRVWRESGFSGQNKWGMWRQRLSQHIWRAPVCQAAD